MFARGRGRTPYGNSLTKSLRPKKTAPLHKKEWVSTNSDLAKYKLTPAELNYRRESRKSHNKAVAQWELREKALRERFRHAGGSPLDKDSQRIIREVFSEKMLLHDVLARSDRTLAVVNELFGEPQCRTIGHPSVTLAPNSDSPISQRSTEPPSLNDSNLDHQALIETENNDYYYSDEEPEAGRLFQSKKKEKIMTRRPQRQRGRHGVNECTPTRAPVQTALNATPVVQRVRSRHNHSEEPNEGESLLVSQVLNPDISPRQPGSCQPTKTRKTVKFNDGSSVVSFNGEKSGLGLLQSMLAEVEHELDSLSPQTSTQTLQHPAQGLTGFSLALVSTLARLVRLIKKREHDAETAIEEKRKLEESLREQRHLIDALTAETMTLREETSSLQAELKQRTAEMDRKLDSAVSAMATHINQHRGADVIATEPEQNAYNKPPTNNSSSSFTSQISPDSGLVELRRLKDTISAQLSQFESIGKSPGSSSEQKCSGSGRTGPETTARLGQYTDQMMHTNAATVNNSIYSVQQRLLELNRQNTAARERLLDLIEQQKQTVSDRVSPLGSPVPPSAFSPQHSDEIVHDGYIITKMEMEALMDPR
nr:spindle and centriole-associated protein 1-like [Nerophis lumbriciformis]